MKQFVLCFKSPILFIFCQNQIFLLSFHITWHVVFITSEKLSPYSKTKKNNNDNKIDQQYEPFKNTKTVLEPFIVVFDLDQDQDQDCVWARSDISRN
jgi:hypothetical protein